jgi:hypothetical protein
VGEALARRSRHSSWRFLPLVPGILMWIFCGVYLPPCILLPIRVSWVNVGEPVTAPRHGTVRTPSGSDVDDFRDLINLRVALVHVGLFSLANLR